MEAWQERVIAELADLETRTKTLGAFIGNVWGLSTLPHEDQDLLRQQYRIMYTYCVILQQRIARF